MESSLKARQDRHTGQRAGPLVSLQGVSRTYRDGNVQALAGVSLEFQAGEFLAVTGPSGCGKSTLLQLIGGLDEPTAGSILFRGRPLPTGAGRDRYRSREVGFVFQAFHLLPNLTARENVQLPLFGDGRTDAERIARADALLGQVGLAERAGHLPGELSIGQRQRVAIARAVVNDPQLILADEPTGSLDSTSGAEVMDLLGRLHTAGGLTLVVVTHDPAIAARADRTIEMLDGRIVGDTAASGAPSVAEHPPA